MSTEETDVVVIGAGPGGYVAAIRAAQRGLETTIVERGEPGGVCLNHGCIPSKALIDVARAADGVGRMTDRGVHAQPTVAFDELSEWQDSVVDRLTGGVEQLLGANGVTYREGTARFRDEHTVEIDPPSLTADSTTLSFEHAVIATGSRPIELPGFSFDDEPVLSSRDVLDLSERPDRLVVVGAGYIGMELSTAFAELGTDVTVLEALDDPLPAYGDELVEPVAERARELGISFSFAEAAQEWYEDITGAPVVVTETEEGDQQEYEADAVLVAVGRRPVADTVDPDAAGVTVDDDGFVVTGKNGETSQEHIYAVGDVAGEPMLAHEASHAALHAVEDIAGGDPGPVGPVPSVVFTEPEIATVGVAPDAAERDVTVGRMAFRGNGRALTAGEEEGFVQVVADADDGTLVGAQIVGPEASELIGELTLAVRNELTAADVAHTVHAHPTLGEALMEAAANVDGEAIHTVNR